MMNNHKILKRWLAAALLCSNTGLFAASSDAMATDYQAADETDISIVPDDGFVDQGMVSTITLEQRLNNGKLQAAQAAYELGLRYAAKDNWKSAARLILEAVRLAPDNTDYLHAASRLAYTLKNYAAARKYQLKVVHLHQERHGQNNEQLVKLMDELSMIYVDENHFSDAETLLKRTLKIREELLGRNAPDIALNLYWLAKVKIHLGDYEDAEQKLQQALEILKLADENQNLNMAFILHSQGELYRSRNQYTKAAAAYRRAIDLWRNEPEEYKDEILMTEKSLTALSERQQQPGGANMRLSVMQGDSVQF